jgi:paraquat-inducible protein A
MHADEHSLRCPFCNQPHGACSLRRGQRAQCVRCGTTLAERSWVGPAPALALAVSGLFFAVPAMLLPFVRLQQFGQVRIAHLTVGFSGLWSHGFSWLGAWVLFCGVLAPLALLALLLVILATERRERWDPVNRHLRRLAAFIEYWAMPEVQVLGVMVAFLKLGSIVTVTVGPGLWCYGMASACMLAAWRRFSLQPAANAADGSSREVPA